MVGFRYLCLGVEILLYNRGVNKFEWQWQLIRIGGLPHPTHKPALVVGIQSSCQKKREIP